VLPGIAAGAELQTRLALDAKQRASLRLSALYLPEKRQSSSAGDLGYSVTAMEAGACAQSRATAVIGFACAGFGLGAVHSVVHTPEPYKPDDRLWAAFRLEAGLNLQIAGPAWCNVGVFDLIAPRLWEFRVIDNGQPRSAFKQRRLMPGAVLGLGLHFD
jgi:hypothetical protein